MQQNRNKEKGRRKTQVIIQVPSTNRK